MGLTLSPTIVTSNEFHAKIDSAIDSIGSENRKVRAEAAAFLLTAPPVFQDKIVNQYKEQIGSLTASLPQQIDSYTTLETAIMTDEEITFGYRVNIVKSTMSTTDINNLREALKEHMLTTFCTIPGSALYMLYGNTITQSYFYSEGSFFFQNRLTWPNCERRQ